VGIPDGTTKDDPAIRAKGRTFNSERLQFYRKQHDQSPSMSQPFLIVRSRCNVIETLEHKGDFKEP
jgi:hypothetical protein